MLAFSKQISNRAQKATGIVSSNMDVSVLFERYTIEEIRDIGKKTRIDIEKKKEELRLMVGERYRDLIEAADTITDMKQRAENVQHSLSKVQELCQNIKHNYPVKPGRTTVNSSILEAKKTEHSQLYRLAAQLKLLMDMPEKLWSALDSGSLLTATRLFLVARHVYTGLQLDSHQSAYIAAHFPVLTRQWTAISHFAHTILKASREMLKGANQKDVIVAECLCSIILLEDSSLKEVFEEFLTSRMSAITSMFQWDMSKESVKFQISHVVQTITSTIRQIYSLFFTDTQNPTTGSAVPCNQIMLTLECVLSEGSHSQLLIAGNSSVADKHLPKSVLDFRPVLKQKLLSIPKQDIVTTCKEWIKTCQQNVSAGVNTLLGFVTTVKGLAAIRDEVWLLLSEESVETWNCVCSSMLNKYISVWNDFLNSQFIIRIKELLQEQFDTTLQTFKQQLKRVSTDLTSISDRNLTAEHNLATYMYIWQDNLGDIPVNMAWGSFGDKSSPNIGPLMMKARAYTPAVQSLCQSFNGKLKPLLEDAACYMHEETDFGKAQSTSPFDKYADHGRIKQMLQTNSVSCIESLVEYMHEHLIVNKDDLEKSSVSIQCITLLDRILLLGRLSLAIVELCPCLQNCLKGSILTIDTRPLERISTKKVQGTPIEELESNKQLCKFSQEAFRIWSDYTCSNLLHIFHQHLLSVDGHKMLQFSTKWDEIEIREDTEDGKSLASVIRVPMQGSWYVQSLLYSLCSEVNRAAGHSLQRSVLQYIVCKVSDGLLDAYKNLLTVPVCQTMALQLLFDIRFLYNMLPRKESSQDNAKYKKLYQSVTELLESQIDPFDLDVFTPYIHAHVMKQTQRVAGLYGILMCLDRHSTFSSGGKAPSQSSQTEQHNVLPLVTPGQRFQLLPISSQRSGSAAPILQPPKPKMNPAVATSAPAHPELNLEQNEHSFLGTMSTIWFTSQ